MIILSNERNLLEAVEQRKDLRWTGIGLGLFMLLFGIAGYLSNVLFGMGALTICILGVAIMLLMWRADTWTELTFDREQNALKILSHRFWRSNQTLVPLASIQSIWLETRAQDSIRAHKLRITTVDQGRLNLKIPVRGGHETDASLSQIDQWLKEPVS